MILSHVPHSPPGENKTNLRKKMPFLKNYGENEKEAGLMVFRMSRAVLRDRQKGEK